MDKELALLESPNTIDVYYLHVPAESNQENLILKLNEDCLRYIAKFLSLQEGFIFASVHPQLNMVVTFKYEKPELDVSSRFFEMLPLESNNWLYGEIGHVLTKLTLTELPQADFFKLLRLLPKLKDLEMYGVELKDPSLVHLLPKKLPLESFTEIDCQLDDEVMTALYKLVNPTLHTINYNGGHITKCLMELRNIHDLEFSVRNADHSLIQFLYQNKSTMEKIMVDDGRIDAENEITLWTVIYKMQHLKSLALYLNYVNLQELQGSNFPELQAVKVISATGEDLQSFLLNICPSRITDLSVPNEVQGLGLQIANRFKSLRKLCIRNGKTPLKTEDMEDWMELRSLAHLETLNLRGIAQVPGDKVWEVLQRFPSLVDLTVPESQPITRGTEMEIELVKRLRGENRTMRLNGASLVKKS